MDRITKFQAFVDGKSYAGTVSSFTPPVPTEKVEEVLTGGMLAPMEVSMGLEKLEASMVFESSSPDVLNLLGIVEQGAVSFEFRGAAVDDNGTTRPVIHTCRGNIKSIDHGTFTAGEKNQTTVSMSVVYYRHSFDGRDMIEIDVQNMVFKTGGQDRLAEQRNAIGL